MAECPAHPGNLVPGCRWCRAGITDDTKGRLVVRVADAVPGARTPAAVIEACAVCLRPVYVDRVSTPDPPGIPCALVCLRCAEADPELAPQVMRLRKAVAAFGALPPARKRRLAS